MRWHVEHVHTLSDLFFHLGCPPICSVLVPPFASLLLCSLWPFPSSSPVSLLRSLPHSFSFAPFFSLRFPVSCLLWGAILERLLPPRHRWPPRSDLSGPVGPSAKGHSLKSWPINGPAPNSTAFSSVLFFFFPPPAQYFTIHVCIYMCIIVGPCAFCQTRTRQCVCSIRRTGRDKGPSALLIEGPVPQLALLQPLTPLIVQPLRGSTKYFSESLAHYTSLSTARPRRQN